MSTRLSKRDLEALLRRVDLTLTPAELGWVAQAFDAYRQQIDALHRLPLEDEEVGTAFMPADPAKKG